MKSRLLPLLRVVGAVDSLSHGLREFSRRGWQRRHRGPRRGGEFLRGGSRRPTVVAGLCTIEATLAKYGAVSGLVNNAGGQYRVEMKTIKGFESVVRNNLTGGFIFMREVYNRWMAGHGGAIVNIIAEIWNGWPEFAHSAAARGGMLTLSETAACEWSASRVRVNTVAPGGCPCSDTAPGPRYRRPSCSC